MLTALESARKNQGFAETLFILLLISIPVITYYWIFTLSTPNIPFWDDYYSAVQFMTVYRNADSFSDKINLLFKQHNEHKIVFAKLLTVLNHSFSGKLNFQFLNLVGNLSLLGLLYVLFRIFRKQSGRYLYFIPLPFLLFQLQYWGGSNWTIVTTTVLWGTLFAFASLYLLSNSRNSYTAFSSAVLFAVLATFTTGNGMFTFIAAFSIFFLKPGYAPKLIFAWLTVMIVVILLYFLNYTKQLNQPQVLNMLITNPLGVIKYFFSFIGSAILTPLTVVVSEYVYDPYILKPLKGACLTFSFLAGLLFSVLYLYLLLFQLKYLRQNPLLFSLLTFLLLTGGVAALSRANLGFDQAFTTRYKFNSLLIIILYYLIFLEITRIHNRKLYAIPFIALSVGFYFLSYGISKRQLESHEAELITGVEHYHKHGDASKLGFYADPREVVQILQAAEKHGIYTLPTEFRQLQPYPPGDKLD